jgi:RNA polymerase sigma factor (sigma-70 family)
MQALDDDALLREYVEHASEEAFAMLVTRHIDKVYSVALRRTRNPHLAEEITQTVFEILAQKAQRLRKGVVLSGWLYQTARLTAVTLIRSEIRRTHREQEAHMRTLSNDTESSVWPQIEPLLDTAMAGLNEIDRHAVVLRFFDGKSLKEVGVALGGSEDAAKMRVNRAVEKLRLFFTRRGIVLPADALTAAISANAVQPAPVGLAAAISIAAAFAGRTIATTATATAIKTIAMTTLQKTLVTATIVGAVGTGVYEARRAAHLKHEVQALQQQLVTAARPPRPPPRLPAPRLAAAPSTEMPAVEQPFTNLLALLMHSDPPKLSRAQVEPFLQANRRSAASLLAAFRTTGDAALLQEAVEKHPTSGPVNFSAIFESQTPEERRLRLDLFKQAAPENALANYLSAQEYLKSGQTDAAVKELADAQGKTGFQDYTQEFAQNMEESYRAAGFSQVEAKVRAAFWVPLPHLAELKGLAQNLTGLAGLYRQGGDEPSAQSVLQMGVSLGRRLDEPYGQYSLLQDLFGITIENIALKGLPPDSLYDESGRTVQARLDELAGRKDEIKRLNDPVYHDTGERGSILENLSEQDLITYFDRLKVFGELDAIRWAVARQGGP